MSYPQSNPYGRPDYGQRPSYGQQQPTSPQSPPYSQRTPYPQQNTYPQQTPYSQQQQTSYTQQHTPYPQQSSFPQEDSYSQRPPYNQQSSYTQQAPYSPQTQYGSTAPNRYNAAPRPQNDLEMASLTQSAAPYPISNPAPPPRDPHEVINECRRITEGVSELNEQLAALQAAQTRSLNDSNNAPATAELETINTSIMSTYKALIARMKKIKTLPESNSQMNRAQIGLADRSLKDAFQRYKVIESAHQKRIREQIERQYRITRPDASDDEVRAATDDPNAQIFAQALRNSNRRGDGRLVLGAVRERHEAIARIERQMEELAVLFQDMAAAVAQQEPMVQRIEQQAEETHTNVEAGVQHLIPAVKSARAARKKKWICLGLSILILIIIVIVLLIVLKILKVY